MWFRNLRQPSFEALWHTAVHWLYIRQHVGTCLPSARQHSGPQFVCVPCPQSPAFCVSHIDEGEWYLVRWLLVICSYDLLLPVTSEKSFYHVFFLYLHVIMFGISAWIRTSKGTRADCTRFTGNLYFPDREARDIVMLNLNTIGMCNLWTRGIKPAAENGGWCSNHNQQCRIRCKLTENGELKNIHVNILQIMSINHNHALIVKRKPSSTI